MSVSAWVPALSTLTDLVLVDVLVIWLGTLFTALLAIGTVTAPAAVPAVLVQLSAEASTVKALDPSLSE